MTAEVVSVWPIQYRLLNGDRISVTSPGFPFSWVMRYRFVIQATEEPIGTFLITKWPTEENKPIVLSQLYDKVLSPKEFEVIAGSKLYFWSCRVRLALERFNALLEGLTKRLGL